MDSHNSPSTSHIQEKNDYPVRTELHAHAIQQFPAIEKLLLHLEGKGKSPRTIEGTKKALTLLAKRADLQNTQEVELAIARYKDKDGHNVSNHWKAKLCTAYQHYCKFYKIEWEKAVYTPEERGIQPPTNEKIQMLIASAKGELSIKLDISNQTGLRPIEMQGEKGLRARDIHPDQNTITALNTKKCNARPAMKITPELSERLQRYITLNNVQPDEMLFKGNEKRYGEHFRRFRNRLAQKLNDPTIKSIRLYDLRHAYCTRQLLRVQNAETVRIIMGHKRLNTTQKYLHILAELSQNGEWVVEGTTDNERAKELLKADFIYQLTAPDGTMLFRKRK